MWPWCVTGVPGAGRGVDHGFSRFVFHSRCCTVTASISGRHRQLPRAVVVGCHHGFSVELAGKRRVPPAAEEAAGNRSCLEDREEEEDGDSLRRR